jgi:hypothetical protein
MTTATGRSGPNGRVWEVAGVLVSAWVEAEVRGRSEAMGRSRALACPWGWTCTRWRRWVAWARPGLGRASLSLARGVYHRVQESVGYLPDKVRERREGRDEVRHGEWHGGVTWACHGANHHGRGQIDLGELVGY